MLEEANAEYERLEAELNEMSCKCEQLCNGLDEKVYF